MDLITHHPTLSMIILLTTGMLMGWGLCNSHKRHQLLAAQRARVLSIVQELIVMDPKMGGGMPSSWAIESRYGQIYGPPATTEEVSQAIEGLRKRGRIFRTTINHNTDKALAEVYGIPS